MSEPSIAEMVAFARGEAAWFRRNRGDVGEQDQYIMTAKANKHDAIADALERLAQIETEHQPSVLPELVRQWLQVREGKVYRDCGATAAVCRAIRQYERLAVEHQGCTENMASLARERDEAVERLEHIEASASFEFDELRGWLVMFSGALAAGNMEGPRPDEARKLDIVRAHLERLARERDALAAALDDVRGP